jgi:hypothetical protein
MYLLKIVLLFILVNLSYTNINISINNRTGEYNLTVNNRLWVRSSYTSLYTYNQWFT